MIKQFLLASTLIIAPVFAFTAGYTYMVPAAVAADQSLGDLSKMQAIIADVQAIVKKGDFAAAETRITDFETAWDDAEPTLHPMNKAAWGNVDDASDAALKTLRKGTPTTEKVEAAVDALAAALANPSGAAEAAGGVKQVSGIAVTDETGHPIPCEEMIKASTAAMSGGKISEANKAAVTDFVAKATERCNADDDQHADEFSAQALALAGM